MDDLEKHPYASRLGSRLGGLWRMVDAMTVVFALAIIGLWVYYDASAPNVSPLITVIVAAAPFGVLLILPCVFLQRRYAVRAVVGLIIAYAATALLFWVLQGIIFLSAQALT